jgi:hypothetical protein
MWVRQISESRAHLETLVVPWELCCHGFKVEVSAVARALGLTPYGLRLGYPWRGHEADGWSWP